MYLDKQTNSGLLTRLRARAATGSRLAVSLATHAAGVDSAELVAAANVARQTGTTEPWRTILPIDEHLALLTRCGWRVERVVDQVELEARAPAGRSMLVTARPAASATPSS